MTSGEQRLANRIRDEIPLLEISVVEAAEDWSDFIKHDRAAYLKAVALDLQAFYSGMEALFLRIAREIDGYIPEGETWHLALLQQMAQALPSRRPAVLGPESLRNLDELRGFRHRIRNIYVFNLDAGRMQVLVADLPLLWPRIRHELAVFADYLSKAE